MRPYEQNLTEFKDATTIRIKGELPRSICGTYLRNGPGNFHKGGACPQGDDNSSMFVTTVAHPFDGDGAVVSVKFDGSAKAQFRARFVETAEYVAEQMSKRWMSRGTFGTNLKGGRAANALDAYPRNAANISVMAAAGRLFALFEGGQPHELDPDSLRTLGITTLNGLLEIGAPFHIDSIGLSGVAGSFMQAVRKLRQLEPSTVKVGGDAFASHYKYDQQRGRIVCMSFQVELQGDSTGFQTYLRFYELNEHLEVQTVQNYDLHGYAFIHDFAITKDSILLMVNATSLHLQDFVLGEKGIIHCIKYDKKKPLQVVIIPRKIHAEAGGAADTAEHVFGWAAHEKEADNKPGIESKAWTFNLKPQFVQHIANAWTEQVSSTEQLVHVAYIGYETMPDFLAWSGPGRNFADINPDEQPHSLLRHATFRISKGDIDNGKPEQQELSPSLMEPLGNPLLKPHLKPSVQVALGSSCLKLDPKPLSSTNRAPESSWDDWYGDLNVVVPEVQHFCPYVRYPPSGCSRVVSKRVLEFPCVNPDRRALPTRYVFGAASLHPHKNRPQQAIAKFDMHTGTCEYWSEGWRYYVGEPEFIPSLPEYSRVDVEEELDGWILSICYDGERNVSEVVVLDAADLSSGPVARAELPVVVPHGLHGTWVPCT